MTEHSAVIFVFFFLAEYASIILICILNSILFLGGYLFDFNFYLYPFIYILQFIEIDSYVHITNGGHDFNIINLSNYNPIIEIIVSATIIGFKACIMIFTFI
jgi:NADH-ubiquinone oxidoreductase chain 1